MSKQLLFLGDLKKWGKAESLDLPIKEKKSKYKSKKRLFQSERGKNIQNFLSFKFAFQLEVLDSDKCYRRRIRTKLDATI
jgi:hypothetical protein